MQYLINVKDNFGQAQKHYIIRTPGGRNLALPVKHTKFYDGRAIIPMWLASKISGKVRQSAIDRYFK